MSVYLGIDIGGTAVKIGLVDENNRIICSETRSVNFDGYKTPIMTTVIALAREMLDQAPEKPAAERLRLNRPITPQRVPESRIKK